MRSRCSSETHHATGHQRRAFTLVELLVVMGLMIVLVAMTLYIVPSINNEQKATQAGTQLQQWIEIAKQRAGRDRAPRGIRLVPGTVNSLQVTQLEYLEQPPEFWLGQGSTFNVTGATYNLSKAGPPVPGWVVTFSENPGITTTFSGNTNSLRNFFPKNPKGPANPNAGSYPVQPGDRIVLGPQGETHTIAYVSDNRPFPVTPVIQPELTLATQPLVTSGWQYRIIRQPRPIGDDPLLMPVDIIIDVQPRGLGFDLPTQTLVPNGPPVLVTPIDIMFAPDGKVIGPMAAYDKIILWVRDVTVLGGPGDAPPAQGDPTLVCIYTRTGLIAACPVDLYNSNSSPYTFTANGRRSSQ